LPVSEEETVQVLSEGKYIRHDTYGLGIVTEADSERTVIHFESHGLKKFVTSIMTAEVLGETPDKPIKLRKRIKKPTAKAAAARA
jgi:phosphoglycolate phosphatase-like HAD superfamily hydrolase